MLSVCEGGTCTYLQQIQMGIRCILVSPAAAPQLANRFPQGSLLVRGLRTLPVAAGARRQVVDIASVALNA